MRKFITLFAATAVTFGTVVTSFAGGMTFTDVSSEAWYYNDVKLAVESGVVNGKSVDTYCPDDKLTYAEAIKLAACMNQREVEGSITLTNGNPWYQPYVEYCKDNGIIPKDKEYIYTDFATRAGYMEIFANALPDEALKKINNVPDNAIPDVASSKAYAWAVYKLYRAGILQGVDSEHNCTPLANITRSEVAAILTRMMNEGERIKFNMGSVSIGGGGSSTKKQKLKVENLTGDELEIPDLTKGEVKVKATGGEGEYEYAWEYNYDGRWLTVNFGGGDQYTFTGTPNTDTLEIAATVEDYSGDMKVRCIVTDEDGTSETSSETHVKAIKQETEKEPEKEPEKETEEFLMYAEEIYSISGRGVVATGRVVKGNIKTSDEITIIHSDGSKTETTVAGIEMFRKMLDEAEAGDNIGLLFADNVTKEMVERGETIIASDSSYTVGNTVKGTLTLLAYEDGGRKTPIEDGHKPQFYYYANDITGEISGLTEQIINPGETQENIKVVFTTHKGVWYVGQEFKVREGGREFGTFTVTALDSEGGRKVLPTGKSQYIED